MVVLVAAPRRPSEKGPTVRTTSLLLSASVGAVLAMGVTVLPASAATAVPAVPSSPQPSAIPAVPATPTPVEAGYVSVSPASVAPGGSVRVSGTCPEPPAGAPEPTVQSVTSAAFTGQEAFSKTDPMAFDGTATVASSAAAGSHPVLLTCSNGTATGSVTVTGGGSGPTPVPAPHPSGHSSGSDGGSAGETTHGGVFAVATDTPAAPEQPAESGTPWGWIAGGVAVVVVAGGGAAYAATRRRRGGDADTPTQQMHL
jgi:hypothetical protein